MMIFLTPPGFSAHAFPQDVTCVRRQEKHTLRNGEPIRETDPREPAVVLYPKLELSFYRIVSSPLLPAQPTY